jgi:ABC-type transporter Mla maintaining outer membrane lipid asymmetry ATPase subunit MlaF
MVLDEPTTGLDPLMAPLVGVLALPAAVAGAE